MTAEHSTWAHTQRALQKGVRRQQKSSTYARRASVWDKPFEKSKGRIKMVISFQTKYLCKHFDWEKKGKIFASHLSGHTARSGARSCEWNLFWFFFCVAPFSPRFRPRRHFEVLGDFSPLCTFGVYLTGKKKINFVCLWTMAPEDNYPFVTRFCFASSRTRTFSFFFFASLSRKATVRGETQNQFSSLIKNRWFHRWPKRTRPHQNHKSAICQRPIVLTFMKFHDNRWNRRKCRIIIIKYNWNYSFLPSFLSTDRE